jgi:cholesterol transport system auxiliary component
VQEPLTTSPLDSDRVIVRPTPETVATLKGAQWSDRLPRLVQTRLVQSFENSRLLRSVARPEAKIQADVALTSEIRRFDIDVAAGEAVIEISAKLVAEKSGRIVAARIFQARAAGSANDGAAAASALDQTLAQVLRQIVTWGAQAI